MVEFRITLLIGDSMLQEYRDIISKLRVENAHFAKLFEKHSNLDHKISDVTGGREHMDYIELDGLKKKKLQLKDKLHAMCVAYQKANV